MDVGLPSVQDLGGRIRVLFVGGGSPSSESESVNELPLPPRLPALPTDAGVVAACCWIEDDPPTIPAKLLRLFNAGTVAMASDMGILSGMVRGILNAAAAAAAAAAPASWPPPLLLPPLFPLLLLVELRPWWIREVSNCWSSFFILSLTDGWIERNCTGINDERSSVSSVVTHNNNLSYTQVILYAILVVVYRETYKESIVDTLATPLERAHNTQHARYTGKNGGYKK